MPAETTGYMVLGFVVVFSVMGLYIGSLALRWRNAMHDEQFIDDNLLN